ncbi:hypothetical protein SAMN05443252_10422 [Bacillus sp. OV322]|uniref:DUF5412 family protein n=1 Tax=Bacillus sp. OV322 TaxID=1882764 RepID=UPI0008E3E31A|nr:DUF5412 family protein [Bacillus sp. OV322]SFC51035.1 hypothetical protein SAMN05443252_10422 [Bacillus sp. OV322]
MKRKLKLILFLISIPLILFIFYWGFTYFSFSFEKDVSKGKLTDTLLSPDGSRIAKSYFDVKPGALGPTIVIVEIVNNETNKSKIIYRSIESYNFSMKWENNNILNIHGHKLNVDNEIYDESGNACNSLAMKNQYKKCYKGR